MAIQFEFYESPNTIGTRKKRYHARVVNWQNVTTDRLAEEIHASCTLTVADIKATIISLSEKLAQHLQDGERVHIEGLGYFHVSLACPETRTPKSTRAGQVKVKSVTFRADQQLKSRMVTVKMSRSKIKIHSAQWGEEALEEELTTYFRTNPVLTRRLFQFEFSLTRTTAGRILNRLREENKLKNISTRFNPIYIPAPGYFGAALLPTEE